MKRVIINIFLISMVILLHPDFSLAQNGRWTKGITKIPGEKIWLHSGATLKGKVFIIGGYKQFEDSMKFSLYSGDILIYDIKNDHWEILEDTLAAPKISMVTVDAMESIFIISGADSSWREIGDVEVLDPINYSISRDIPPMLQRRYSAAGCSFENKIYVLGGMYFVGMKNAEVLDLDVPEWSRIADMQQERAYFGAQQAGRKIYAIAGSVQDRGPPINSVEEYDIKTNSWRYVSSLPYNIFQFGSCVYNDRIYLFGGRSNFKKAFESDIMYNDVLMYDPIMDYWQVVDNMPYGRAACTAHMWNDQIYIVGGFDAYADENDSRNSWFPEIDVYRPVKEPIYAIDSWLNRTFLGKEDSIIATARFINHKGNSFTAKAVCLNHGDFREFSFPLYDNGKHDDGLAKDGLYGGYIKDISIEDNFSLNFITRNQDYNESFTSIDAGFKFTTIGPVRCEEVVVSPDNMVSMRIKNHGESAAARSLTVNMMTTNRNITIKEKSQPIPDLRAGEAVGVPDLFSFEVLDMDLTVNNLVNMTVAISSKGVLYWVDEVEVRITQ